MQRRGKKRQGPVCLNRCAAGGPRERGAAFCCLPADMTKCRRPPLTPSFPCKCFLQERKQAWGSKQFQQYIGADVTSLLSVPVWIMEPFTILQKAAEIMEYTDLLDAADKTDDPYDRWKRRQWTTSAAGAAQHAGCLTALPRPAAQASIAVTSARFMPPPPAPCRPATLPTSAGCGSAASWPRPSCRCCASATGRRPTAPG